MDEKIVTLDGLFLSHKQLSAAGRSNVTGKESVPMDQQLALRLARARFGDAVVSITDGIHIVSIRDGKYYMPLGFGENWEDALIDAHGQWSRECVYA